MKASSADSGGQYTRLDNPCPPNLASPLHVHYGEDEGFSVLEGSVRVEIGDQVVELEAGHYAFGPRTVPHRLRRHRNEILAG